MAAGEKIQAERREATILFCDIVGFTTLSTRLLPEEVLTWLDNIFSSLDSLCEKHQVEKIKTIGKSTHTLSLSHFSFNRLTHFGCDSSGDAYMCCTGLIRDQPDHVERMAQFALELREIVNSHVFRTPDTKEPISMRIGMHTGLCVSGIIGRSRLMFDTYGDSVNIASRMESHGVPGEIQCTDVVYRALQGTTIFSFPSPLSPLCYLPSSYTLSYIITLVS
jgi:adenylate cyclase